MSKLFMRKRDAKSGDKSVLAKDQINGKQSADAANPITAGGLSKQDLEQAEAFNHYFNKKDEFEV
jgi:hypothetical protein